MRLRRDTIRVEESAVCVDRLSLHRLPAKRQRALCHLGIRVRREDLSVTQGEPRKIAHANRIRSFPTSIMIDSNFSGPYSFFQSCRVHAT